MREITLPQDVRTFRRTSPAGSSLYKTGYWLHAGMTLLVSEPMTMVFDHLDQVVVCYKDGEDEIFLIVSDLGLEGFVQ
jgi:hypothetical protein